jgi:hypothetical protein
VEGGPSPWRHRDGVTVAASTRAAPWAGGPEKGRQLSDQRRLRDAAGCEQRSARPERHGLQSRRGDLARLFLVNGAPARLRVRGRAWSRGSSSAHAGLVFQFGPRMGAKRLSNDAGRRAPSQVGDGYLWCCCLHTRKRECACSRFVEPVCVSPATKREGVVPLGTAGVRTAPRGGRVTR